jgi:hypothetical protein
MHLELGDHGDGLYYLFIKSAREVMVKKVIIQK